MNESLVNHIQTRDNLADFLTKATSGSKHHKLVNRVVHDIYDNFPKQSDLTWQDQQTDPDHPTDLEGSEKNDPAKGVLIGLKVASEMISCFFPIYRSV
jgi:hypothetical protein